MKIISVDLYDDTTRMETDTGEKIELKLKPYFRIPYRAMEIEFKTIEELKAFCVENQVL